MGLEHCLPASYATLRAARFPCIVKTAVGDFGSTVRFARDARELDAAIAELKLDPRRMNDAWLVQELCEGPVEYRAGQESEIPNFKASYLGRFPLVLADFWTSDHLLERSRSVDAFLERARAEHSS